MFKHIKFKHQILIMPLLAIVALFLLLFVSQFFTERNNKLLAQIQVNFVPALELGRDLEKTLTNIQRTLQDAVSAAEEEELTTADTYYQEFLKLFERGQRNPYFKTEHLNALRTEFQEYYEHARKTSQHVIEGGAWDEQTVEDFQLMSDRYNAISEKLKVMAEQAKEDVSTSFSNKVENHKRSVMIMNIIIFCCAILLGGISIFLSRSITNPLKEAINVVTRFASGSSDVRIHVKSSNEIGELAKAFNNMMNKLQKQDWLKSGHTSLNEQMRGEQDLVMLSRNIITYLSKYLDTQIGAIYLYSHEKQELQLTGSYAYTHRKGNRNIFKLGESLVGQAALEKQRILFTDIPDDYIKIHSGLGETSPRNILVTPLLYDSIVQGVIELGSVRHFTGTQIDFLEQSCESIAIALNSAQSRVKMQDLLEETQRQSEILQVQQEDLQRANEELEEQTTFLKASEEKLKTQQEELQQTNEELEEQTRILEQQKQKLGEKNDELKHAQKLIEEKARDLEQTSKYKSEFLANMSHELRTPLNSLLILSKLLAENKDGNLSEKQIEFADTIHNSGSDLLVLINEVLDLAKVEAGKVSLNIEKMSLKGFASYITQNFTHIAEEKALELTVELAENLPTYIFTDRQRVEQIVKNFLSNAFKFTSEGGITLRITRPGDSDKLTAKTLIPQKTVAISVSDTGIGIPKDKQRLIFEAFQQADGTTSRKYGGTGLGLSISREFTKLLGGEIQLRSDEGKGSTFILYLPETFEQFEQEIGHEEQATVGREGESTESSSTPLPLQSGVEGIYDDRHEVIAPTDKFLLIIEDDPKFAKLLFDLSRERGFKGLIAGDGAAGLQLAYQYKPVAIMLDVDLPKMNGWSVTEKLKQNPETRHIPVHFMSAHDRPLDAIEMGAIGFLSKPVSIEDLNEAFNTIENAISKTIKHLLIVAKDASTRLNIIDLFNNTAIKIMTAQTGHEAYTLLRSNEFDCVVLDLDLPDMSGSEFLEQIRNDKALSYIPTIIYTAKELSKDEELNLQKHAESIIIRGAKSQERLLDEVSLFLHRVTEDFPEIQQKQIRMLRDKETVLHQKTILMVDDDIRNIFALSSVLEEKGMNVVIAENGREALEKLQDRQDIELVLMDIMMPEMDGYETMRHIRKQGQFNKLPIIALTAKAMKGDRQKCIDAGASDYLSKPVDTDKLLSLLRVWLY